MNKSFIENYVQWTDYCIMIIMYNNCYMTVQNKIDDSYDSQHLIHMYVGVSGT